MKERMNIPTDNILFYLIRVTALLFDNEKTRRRRRDTHKKKKKNLKQ